MYHRRKSRALALSCVVLLAAGGLLAGCGGGSKSDGGGRNTTVLTAEGDGVYRGVLTGEDPRLEAGEHYERHTFRATEDGFAGVAMGSSELDSYILVTVGDTIIAGNDDYDGLDSAVGFAVERGITYTVYCTTFAAGETGGYILAVTDIMQYVGSGSATGGGGNALSNLLGSLTKARKTKSARPATGRGVTALSRAARGEAARGAVTPRP
jgi:hypothetical protein